MTLPGPIVERLTQLSRAPILLVASDYDGTLAPIVANPAEATPDRESIVALRALASLPQTYVAVISGRALKELAELTQASDAFHLVGSHGSEFDADFIQSLNDDQKRLRDRILNELERIASEGEGFLIERKPASVAFHFRNADEESAMRALEEIRSGPGALADVHAKHGKKVIELCILETNKGRALDALRHRLGASAVLFLGDDLTDEDAFQTLAGPDLGVKVGPGETAAHERLADTHEVAQCLALLAELREDWITGADAVPIEEHAMLSDFRTVALVTPAARVVWMCLPRIDSPALFAELLGGPTAGYFAIKSADGEPPRSQRYDDDSLTLITEWPNFRVIDYLDCSRGLPRHRAGRTDLVRVIEGAGRVRVEFAPRLDFGRAPTRLETIPNGIRIEDTHDPIVLRSIGVEWELRDEHPHQAAVAEFDLDANSPQVLELRYGTGDMRECSISELERRRQTAAHFDEWAAKLSIPGPYLDEVRRSALTIKALCYGPSGAISAAATTSLPEHIGGVRNWDYRYCWLRDAALAADSLVRLGSYYEALAFLDWMMRVLEDAEAPDRLHPLYTASGRRLPPEGEISELCGYRGSRPVRVSNAAAGQVQLDVFGAIVELMHTLMESGAPLSSEHWRLTEAMVQAVTDRWHEGDHGIWEIRKPRRHHVHSKVMCWVTVDRAINIAAQFLARERPEWRRLRDEIAQDVLEHGYKEHVGAFTAAYDGDDLDAAVLEIGLRGVIAPDDPRFISTVEVIDRELRYGPTVYRYRADDGLPGSEGGFNLCTTWLIQSYVLIGRIADARTLFNAYCELAGQTGLIPEEYGPRTKRALGNHPQLYSHAGLINCALMLAAAPNGDAINPRQT